jgi:hypothetical protein
MALRQSAGRIWITDPTDTHVVFDTAERLFIATDFVSGSYVIPAREAYWHRPSGGSEQRLDQDINLTYQLASVHADADVVLGAFKVTTQVSPQGVHNFGWFSAGGTYIHSQLPKTVTYNNITQVRSAGGYSGYSFVAAGGVLSLIERLIFVCPQPQYTNWFQYMTQNPMTIEYKLYAGSFS